MRNEERFIRRLAGLIIITGFAGGWFYNEILYLVCLFVGINLVQSSFTDFCPPEKIYKKWRS